MLSRIVHRSYLGFKASAVATSLSRRNVHTLGFDAGKWRRYATVAIGGITILAGYTRASIGAKREATIAHELTDQIEGSLNFRNAKDAFKTKSDNEILRSLLVFKMCSYPWLVSSAATIMSVAEKLHLSSLTYEISRHSFFKQFCAGEEAVDVKNTMNRLANNGIATILDLSIETNEGEQVTSKHCDAVTSKIIESIEIASNIPNTFTAVKATALTKPEVLIRASSMLTYIRDIFNLLDSECTGSVSLMQFSRGMHKLGYKLNEKETELLFQKIDSNQDGKVDWIDFETSLSITNPSVRSFFQSESRLNIHCDERHVWLSSPIQGQEEAIVPLHYEPPAWTEEDIHELHALVHRLDLICATAKKMGVRVMIDAEQSYFQPCIDHVAFTMTQRFNQDGREPSVYNTYQMYMKNALNRLQLDYQRAQREGLAFGVKLVRGAYMVSERQRAHDLNLEDPICTTKRETDDNFDQAVSFSLQTIAMTQDDPDRKPLAIMVASHNENSILSTIQQMKDLGIPSKTQSVLFGQLMGMCDHISLTLANQGYNIAKYVPYGPIREAIPYLLRRAQENSALLDSTKTERMLLGKEFKRRLVSVMRVDRIAPRWLGY